VRAAREECASVVASIFVNPTQFSPNEDLDSYPRDLPRDLALLEANGADLVWMPTPATMYPDDFQTWITVEQVSQPLEGSRRPGHFRGVATIVGKLFNAVQPQKAYFGQKDAQQVVVIQQMVRDLNYPIEIIVCPTVREPDGLAMSSRNTYLNPEERQAAAILFRSLRVVEQVFQSGETNAEVLRKTVIQSINTEPLAKLQYVSCADLQTLLEFPGEFSSPALLSLAVFIGKTRLIDNVILRR
jgi:pantoate--beta-alanine ligase